MRHGGVRPRLVAVLAALTGALCPLLVAAAPAGAMVAADDAALPLTVLVDQVAPSVLRPGEDLTVTATVRNDSSTAVDGESVTLRLNRVRPASRAELDAWATGSGGAVGSRVATVRPGLIEPGATVQVQLTVAARNVQLLDQLDVWGPRGLAVEVLSKNGARLGLQRTFALWQPDEVVPQVRVAVLAAVTGPGRVSVPAAPVDDEATTGATPTTSAVPTPGSTASPVATSGGTASASTAALESLTGPGGRLQALLDVAAQDPDIALAVDPALLADARAGGPQARRWAAELTSTLADRDTFTLPWSDPDLATLAHADQTELLAAAGALASDAGSAVASSRALLWASDDEVDRTTLALAATDGNPVVVGTGTLQVEGAVTTARASVDTPSGTVDTLVPDALLTTLVVAPDTVEPGATTATTVQRMLAELAVLAHDGTGDSHDVLLTLGRDWVPDPELTTALLQALRTSPWTRVVSASAELAADDDGADRASIPARAPTTEMLAPSVVQSLADARTLTRQFAAATATPEVLLAGLDDEVLAPLAVAWRASPAGRARLVDVVLADAEQRRTGLSIAPVSNVNIISANAPFRFVVRNELDVPATVAVSVQPRKSCLRPATSEAVTVPAGGELAVPVNLHAVANCDVTVDVKLTDATGATLAPVVTFSARVAPTIENVGTIVVAVLLAVGLVLGIARTVRRGQSALRGARRVADEDARPLPVLGGEVAPAREEPDAGADEDADADATDPGAPTSSENSP